MSKFAINRPVIALFIWLLVILGLGVFATSLDSKFNDSFSLARDTADGSGHKSVELCSSNGCDGSYSSGVLQIHYLE
jgi:uncharacterized membrane protein YdfJ with MMPL/SSD domain